MRIAPRHFERLIAEAIEQIPERFRKRLRNIAVVLEQEPTDEQLSECDIPEGESMYAYYEGVALIERGMDGEPILPDRIVIFQRSFEEDFDTPEQLRRELAVTIAHEIAHHFGTDDDRLEDLGKY